MDWMQIAIGAVIGALIISVIMRLVNFYDATQARHQEFVDRCNTVYQRTIMSYLSNDRLDSKISENYAIAEMRIQALANRIEQLEKKGKR